jgi:hypothetical protein
MFENGTNRLSTPPRRNTAVLRTSRGIIFSQFEFSNMTTASFAPAESSWSIGPVFRDRLPRRPRLRHCHKVTSLFREEHPMPTVSLVVAETLPTGKYDRLDDRVSASARAPTPRRCPSIPSITFGCRAGGFYGRGSMCPMHFQIMLTYRAYVPTAHTPDLPLLIR